jgi:hypothetical protein
MLNGMKGRSSSESVQQRYKEEKQNKGGETETQMDNHKTRSNLCCAAQNVFVSGES